VSRVVLDAEAVQALMDPHHGANFRLRSTLRAAEKLGRTVVIPTVILAELYRGKARTQALDSFLARKSSDFDLRDTDRELAKLVGGLLHAAGMGSEHLADAHVAAVAAEEGGVIVTGDVVDLERLVAALPHVTVASINAP
jgi:predicted nucleic acid-binding protein